MGQVNKQPVVGQHSHLAGGNLYQPPTELPPNTVRLASNGVHELGPGS
jgi:hypothetical protein